MDLKDDLKLFLNPCELFNRSQLIPDQWQKQVLLSNSKRIILLTARQVGKSTVTAALALHQAILKDSALILIASPSLRQSSELFKKIKQFLNCISLKTLSESQTQLELENQSRIVCLPGSEQTIRGYSAPDLLIIDEASMIADDLFSAMTPMLVSNKNARIILLSTPKGERGIFHKIWSANNDYLKIKVTADDCNRFEKSFLDQELINMGKNMFLQEYYCQFIAGAYKYFEQDKINKLFEDNNEEEENDDEFNKWIDEI